MVKIQHKIQQPGSTQRTHAAGKEARLWKLDRFDASNIDIEKILAQKTEFSESKWLLGIFESALKLRVASGEGLGPLATKIMSQSAEHVKAYGPDSAKDIGQLGKMFLSMGRGDKNAAALEKELENPKYRRAIELFFRREILEGAKEERLFTPKEQGQILDLDKALPKSINGVFLHDTLKDWAL